MRPLRLLLFLLRREVLSNEVGELLLLFEQQTAQLYFGLLLFLQVDVSLPRFFCYLARSRRPPFGLLSLRSFPSAELVLIVQRVLSQLLEIDYLLFVFSALYLVL